MNVQEIERLLAEKEHEAAKEWPKANERQIPVALSVGGAGPYEVGWVTKPDALPGLLRALAEEIERRDCSPHPLPVIADQPRGASWRCPQCGQPFSLIGQGEERCWLPAGPKP